MSLIELQLFQFRNYDSLKIELPEEGALFCGNNGSGKTNIFEAISLLTTGKSVRSSSLKEIIQQNKNESFVQGIFVEESNRHRQSLGFSKQKKIVITKDGKEYSTLSSLYQDNRFIYFGPLDILLVTGSPEEKRQFINQIISQKYTEYLYSLIHYKKVIKEVNSLLQSKPDHNLLHVYHKELARLGMIIYIKRVEFFSEIEKEFSTVYSEMSGGDLPVKNSYNPSIIATSEEEYFQVLQKAISKDIELGYTSVGVHRDSYSFKVNNRKMVGFGSQGQMRSCALSFKSSALSYLKKDSKRSVIVAIDDAFSDLDTERRKYFFKHIQNNCQLFIALHTQEEANLYSLPLFTISEGHIKNVT